MNHTSVASFCCRGGLGNDGILGDEGGAARWTGTAGSRRTHRAGLGSRAHGENTRVTRFKPEPVRNGKSGGSNFYVTPRHGHLIKNETVTVRWVQTCQRGTCVCTSQRPGHRGSRRGNATAVPCFSALWNWGVLRVSLDEGRMKTQF